MKLILTRDSNRTGFFLEAQKWYGVGSSVDKATIAFWSTRAAEGQQVFNQSQYAELPELIEHLVIWSSRKPEKLKGSQPKMHSL